MTDFFGADIPFARHCGIVALEGTPEKTRLGLTLGEAHQNHMGTGHGGVILTLLDIALGSVARLASGLFKIGKEAVPAPESPKG